MLLQLCLRGEWLALEQSIKGLDRGDPELSAVDEDSGLTVLMVAVRDNRLAVVERLLELGVNPADRSKDGRTALHVAAAHSKDDIIKLLVKKSDPNTPGGPVDQLPLHYAASRCPPSLPPLQTLLRASNRDARLTPDKDGSIALLLAVEGGNMGGVKELLATMPESQLASQTRVSGDAALHVCIRRKDLEMAKILLDHGAPVNTQNGEGQTALHIAAFEGDEILLKILYQNKANPNIPDQMERSPLHIAVERGHAHVAEILTEKFKSNVLARTKDGSTLLHIASQCGHPDTALALLRKGVPLHMPNKSGEVCLHAASRSGHAAVVRALLQKGAMLDSRTRQGLSALHLAVQSCRPQVVQVLLGYGACVQLHGGQSGESPLHMSAQVREGEKVAEMLLKSGAEVNAEQQDGETAVHAAARHGGLKMLRALLAEGGDPTWRSKAGESPLHVAVRHRHAHVVEELLLHLANQRSREEACRCVRQENVRGEACLHLAVASGVRSQAGVEEDEGEDEGQDVRVIRTLMTYEADITAVTAETEETPLHYCARQGNTAALLVMLSLVPPSLQQGAVNKHYKKGWSPLLLAAERGHLMVVRTLLQHQARVDVFDQEGRSALHLASQRGHVDIVDVLLSHNAFVNAKTKLGLTPLHLGAQSGSTHLVALLVTKHQASIDALSLSKQTPLHLAAVGGHLEVCSRLLQLGADITAADIRGQTPLHLAAESDHSEIVQLFLRQRPELATLANMEGATCTHIAAAKGSLAVTRELLSFSLGGAALCSKTSGSGPLHLASSGGHAEVVKVLLEAGAPPLLEDAEGMTAVHLAARRGHTHLLEVLKHSFSLSISSTKTGLSALHVAACHGQVEVVRELLTQVPATVCSHAPSGGPRDGTPAESGYTPLHLAAQSGHEGVVRLLLNSPGVQADAQTDVQGSSPLHLAAQRGHVTVVGLLLSRSAPLLHLRDAAGRTCLHLAAASGHVAMVRQLLGQGADISITDQAGWTALHCAAQAGCLDVVRHLVESGGNTGVECQAGRTPLQYAAMETHLHTLSFLLRRADNNTLRLLEDRKFVFDLMVCGRLNSDLSLDEFILSSPAPLDTAVRLSRALDLAALREKERSADLSAAAGHCEDVASDLLRMAPTGTAGVGSGQGSGSGPGTGAVLCSVDHRGLSQLDLLLEAGLQGVVAQPAVQAYLSELWLGCLAHWDPWRLLLLFMAMLLCPPLWVALSLPLTHRYNTVPIVKFMSHLVSHLFLLLLLILTTVYPPLSPPHLGRLTPSWTDWLLLSWMAGMLVSELSQPGERAGLAWVRVLVLLFSGSALLCHFLAVVLQGFSPAHLHCLFARNALLAVAMALGFVQLLDFLSFHHLFGPWAVIIRDLLRDLARFAVILALFHTAFTLSLTALCQPVYPYRHPNPTTTPSPVHFLDNATVPTSPGDEPSAGEEEEEPEPSHTPLELSVLLFFALFGLTDPEALPPLRQSPPTAALLARLAFGSYLVVTVIVLINLLIAMMSNTYQRIQARSDAEWKFGRAVLIRDMSRKSGTPSPLNLVTHLYHYAKVLCKHAGKVCPGEGGELKSEEEDQEGGPGQGGQGSLDLLTRNRTKKRTQIQPEGGVPGCWRQVGQVRVEQVTDWRMVVQRYRALRGQSVLGEGLHPD